MDGKGRCIDNIFIERLWRSLKYECIYLHAWETGSQAKASVSRWITFYNHQRPHAAHGGQPPTVGYCGFRKFPDGDFGKSRTRVSVNPGQGFR
jgi:putative transposase